MNDSTRLQWRTSSYSGNSGNCVQVATTGQHIAVRDSKDPEGAILLYTREKWQGFVRTFSREEKYL